MGCVLVSAMQSCNLGEPPELQRLRELFGGGIHQKGAKHVNWRTKWEWWRNISSLDDAFVLRCMAKFDPFKGLQAKVALEFLATNRREWEPFIQRLKDMRWSNDIEIDAAAVSDAFIAGLFAADGCLFSSDIQLSLIITKPKCLPLLHAMAQRIPGSTMSDKRGRIEIHAQDKVLDLLHKINKHIFGQKQPQVQAAIAYLSRYPPAQGKKRTDEQVHDRGVLCEELKHQGLSTFAYAGLIDETLHQAGSAGMQRNPGPQMSVLWKGKSSTGEPNAIQPIVPVVLGFCASTRRSGSSKSGKKGGTKAGSTQLLIVAMYVPLLL